VYVCVCVTGCHRDVSHCLFFSRREHVGTFAYAFFLKKNAVLIEEIIFALNFV